MPSSAPSHETHPRARLLSGPTPIEYLARISEKLDIELSVKRDDLAGPSFGGNKARQLEYYLGAAQQANADTILITGAVQSNFVRTAAACAARLGLRTIVQLEDRVPNSSADYAASGNVLLNGMLGAEIMYYPHGEDEAGADAALRARAEQERQAGYTPYVIPLALGNPPLGALGYMRAATEILEQKTNFDFVVIASGSGLTHAGMLAGLCAANHPARVIGSCVRRPKAQQTERIRTVLDNLSILTGGQSNVPNNRIEIWDGALAPGYGQIGPATSSAMQMAASMEGLIVDPVYTAKVFAAIPALVQDGTIPTGARVLFVHTGGLASLFAYRGDIQSALSISGAS